MMKTQIINVKVMVCMLVICMLAFSGYSQEASPPEVFDTSAEGLPDSIDKISKGFPDKKDCIELKISPNPIRNSSTIQFEMKEEGMVEICLYNQQGVKVVEIVKQKFPSGTNKVTFTPDNLPSGTYYLCLCNGMQKGMRRCVII